MPDRFKTFQLFKNPSLTILIRANSLVLQPLQKIRQKLKLHFPHLLGKLQIFLSISFFLVLLLNLVLPKSDFETNKTLVLNDPTNNSARLVLGRDLLKNNQFNEAKNEFGLAGSLENLTNIQKIESQPEKIKEEILRWQKTVTELPNYRDAYIKLGILNWQVNRLFDAQKFLQKALFVDPNNEVVNNLLHSFFN